MTERSHRGSVASFCQSHHDILQQLASLSDTDFERLTWLLSEYGDRNGLGTRPDLIAYLVTEFRPDGFLPSSAQDLVDVALDLAVMRRLLRRRDPESDLVQDVVVELRQLNSIEGPQLEARLQSVLEKRAITSIAGAEDVIAETDQLLIEARIVTDERPVYEEEDEDGLPTLDDFIILHNLRIRYWREGQERTFSVAMRDSDLQDLAKKIRRAELKAESLKRTNKTKVEKPSSQ